MMGDMIPQERGVQGGSYACVLIQTHILEIILSLCINLLFDVECSHSQSLNSCKRVGVRSHIP
jgi:hypothetical protein